MAGLDKMKEKIRTDALRRADEIIAAAEVIGPVVEVGSPVIVQLGQGLLGAAAIAHGHGVAGVKFQRPTAHFAFEDCHFESPSTQLLLFKPI